MTIRNRLLGLVLVLVLPLLLAMLAGVRFLYEEQRQAQEQEADEAVRAMAWVVEREIAQRETVLNVLAASPALRDGDLAAFRSLASEFAGGWDTAITYADLGGRQLLNTRVAPGQPLPPTHPGLASLRVRSGPGATLVSDLYVSPVGGQWSFAVQVPVRRNGQVVGHLSMGGFAANLQQLLARHRVMPPHWIWSVVDRTPRVVARSHSFDQLVGKPPTAAQVAGLSQGGSGRFEVESLDGQAVVAFFRRSEALGWTFVVAMPAAELNARARDATAILAGVSLLMLALASVATLLVARSIVRPVHALSSAAEAVGRDEEPPPLRSGLAEIDQIGAALQRASRQIRGSKAELERRVAQARSEADAAHASALQAQKLEAMGRLTGGVAHDFNNLLMVVSSNTHVLRRKLPPEWRDSPQIAAIDRSVKAGTRLTRQLLAFARRQPLRSEVTSLAERLPAMMELVRAALRSGIELRCHVAEGTWPVEVDVGELELAILNLSVNANDAMPSGGTLDISAANGDGQDFGLPCARVVVLSVADSGTGIPRELLDRVCEPFFTTKPPGQGTGLGLSQVYGLCTQTGGTLRIDSSPGRGTCVRMVLCASAAAADPAPAEQAEPQQLNCRVLLVEDNAELSRAAEQVLAALGCSVACVGNADAAVARLQEGLAVDLVLSDIRMPGSTDGFGLAAWIRRHRPGLPVLLMTGYAGELQAGLDDGLTVLAKPFEPASLAAAMRKALDGHAAGPAPAAPINAAAARSSVPSGPG